MSVPISDPMAVPISGYAGAWGLASVVNGSNDTVPFEKNCIEWVDQSLAACVQTWWGIFSVFIGFSSIGFWLFAQAPQLYLNYKNKNADSLALPFLVAWLIGDSTNLIGSLLSGQLSTQIYTSIYFCIIDFILFSQWIMYYLCGPTRKHKKKKGSYKKLNKKQRVLRAVLPAVGLAATLGGGVALYTSPAGPVEEQHLGRVLFNEPRRGLDVDPNAGYPFVQGPMHTAGYIIGIISAIFYLFSRVPQIVKNYHRQSTGGLSFIMFVMAIMGNTTYAIGVLIAAFQPYLYDTQKPPNRISTDAFIMDKLPWLFGSIGTLMFDATIFVQFLWYEDKSLTIMEDSGATEQEPLISKTSTHITPPDSDDSFEDEADSGYRPNLMGSPLFFPASKKSSSYQNLVSGLK